MYPYITMYGYKESLQSMTMGTKYEQSQDIRVSVQGSGKNYYQFTSRYKVVIINDDIENINL